MARRTLFLFAVLVSPSFAEDEDICIAPSEGTVVSLASSGHALFQSMHVRSNSEQAGRHKHDVKKAGVRFSHERQLASHQSVDNEDMTSEDMTTFFYHVHLPRTGGTSVATLLVANICMPPGSQPEELVWTQRCTKTCKTGLTDNTFACYPGRDEHPLLAQSLQRAQRLKQQTGARRLVYVTSLRSGSDRAKSQWLYEINTGGWIPPPGIPKISNESLKLFITGAISAGNTHLTRQRGNAQVAWLASVVDHDTHVVDSHDLEVAKKALMTGDWLIGFSMCMGKVDKKLMTMTHREYKQRDLPHISQSLGGAFPEFSQVRTVHISPEIRDLVDSRCWFDNELYNWAWNEAKNGEDSRFTETC